MQAQISYSYPIKVWALTVLLSPYVAKGLFELVIHQRIAALSFDWLFIMALAGAVLSLPALGLIFSLFCYLVSDIHRPQTLRVTVIFYGVALMLLTWSALGMTVRELFKSESSYFLLSYLGVMVVAGSLVHIECAEESSQFI